MKVGGGGGGGGLNSDSKWGGSKHLFLSNSLKFPKKWGGGGGGLKPPPSPSPSAALHAPEKYCKICLVVNSYCNLYAIEFSNKAANEVISN